MGSVTAAAGRQACVVAPGKECRKRPQTEEQNQEDGKPAPHLEFMLHEELVFQAVFLRRSGIIGLFRFSSARKRNCLCLK
jgi:hypothetical protein